MPELSGRELLKEWQRLMESIASGAASVAGRPEVPQRLTEAMEQQLALLTEVIERERRLHGEITRRVIAPVDAVFDLLEESGATLRRQAEALAASGRALEEAAALMTKQAELFERTIGTLRLPTELARAASGLDRPEHRGRS